MTPVDQMTDVESLRQLAKLLYSENTVLQKKGGSRIFCVSGMEELL
jgi:hypothetical protein